MKNLSKIFKIQILLLSIFCCTDSKNLNDEKVWADKTVSLQGQIVDSVPSILVSREIKIIDSLIIIRDADDSEENPVYRVFKITDKNRLEYYSEFGRIGKGPNEFMWPMEMQIFCDTISIFDRTLLRNYLITGRDIANKETPINFVTENIPKASVFRKLLRSKKNLYFGTIYENRFAFFRNDSIIPMEIPYPEDGIVTHPYQKAMVYQGGLIIQPNGKRIIYASSDGHILEIYEQTGEASIQKIFSDIYEFPKYEPLNTNGDIVSANINFENNRKGFYSVSATNQFIYALYCGKLEKDERTDYANIIYIYDWDGNRIKKLILDKDLAGITVDKNNKKIYGLHTNPENDMLTVVCYSL